MNKHTPALCIHADKEAPYGGLEIYLREIGGGNLQINTWCGAKREMPINAHHRNLFWLFSFYSNIHYN